MTIKTLQQFLDIGRTFTYKLPPAPTTIEVQDVIIALICKMLDEYERDVKKYREIEKILRGSI